MYLVCRKKISRIIEKNESKLGEYKDISDCQLDYESDKEALPVIDTKRNQNENDEDYNPEKNIKK